MPDQTFRNIITVLDQASAPLRAINAKITALGAPVRHLGLSLAGVGAAAGFTKLERSAGNLIQRFGTLRREAMGLLGPLGLIAGGGTIAGLAALTHSASEYGAQLHDAAIMTGVQADALARMHYQARLTGTGTEAVDKGLAHLNKTIGDAASGRNRAALVMFQRLGISLRDQKGNLRSAADVWGDLAEVTQKNTNATLRESIAANAFGARMGAQLIPMLAQGRDALKLTGAEAERLGLVLGQDGVDNAKKFEDSWIKLQAAGQGLTYSIGAQLFPVIQPMLESMTDWIAANRAVIATKLKDFVVSVAEALRKVDWVAVARDAQSFLVTAKSVIEYLGGMRAVMIGMAVVAVGPFLAALANLAWALTMFGGALGMIPARLVAAFAVAPILDFVTAMRAGYGAMAAFNLIVAANPIGVVLTAIGLLAAGAFMIYRNWTPIKAFFLEFWRAIADAARRAWVIIEPIVNPIAAVKGVVNWAIGTQKVGAPVSVNAGAPPPSTNTGVPLPQATPGVGRARFLAPGAAPTLAPVTAPSMAANSPLAASLYSPGGDGGASAPQKGEVKVKVDLTNLPPGSKVSTETRGAMAPPETNVGYAWGGGTAPGF
jgi:hypothetical protein